MDFPAKYQRWDSVEPVELFSAPVISSPEGKGGIVKHLEKEGQNEELIRIFYNFC